MELFYQRNEELDVYNGTGNYGKISSISDDSSRFIAGPQRGKGRKSKEKPIQIIEQKGDTVQSRMLPPPGFASIVSSPATAQTSVQSSSKKPRQQRKGSQPKDAAPAEVKPSLSKEGAHSEGGSRAYPDQGL